MPRRECPTIRRHAGPLSRPTNNGPHLHPIQFADGKSAALQPAAPFFNPLETSVSQHLPVLLLHTPPTTARTRTLLFEMLDALAKPPMNPASEEQ